MQEIGDLGKHVDQEEARFDMRSIFGNNVL